MVGGLRQRVRKVGVGGQARQQVGRAGLEEGRGVGGRAVGRRQGNGDLDTEGAKASVHSQSG